MIQINWLIINKIINKTSETDSGAAGSILQVIILWKSNQIFWGKIHFHIISCPPAPSVGEPPHSKSAQLHFTWRAEHWSQPQDYWQRDWSICAWWPRVGTIFLECGSSGTTFRHHCASFATPWHATLMWNVPICANVTVIGVIARDGLDPWRRGPTEPSHWPSLYVPRGDVHVALGFPV